MSLVKASQVNFKPVMQRMDRSQQIPEIWVWTFKEKKPAYSEHSELVCCLLGTVS